MDLDRRQFVVGGLSLLAGLKLSSSYADAGLVDPGGDALRFPGDPGKGRLYYGAAVMASLSLPDLEAALRGILTVRRSYFEANLVPGLVRRVTEDHGVGRFPLVSIKVPGTWADVAAGRYDAWLNDLLTQLRGTSKPVMLVLHHEPENDVGPAGMTADAWVRMQQHAIARAAALAPNTTIVPTLMQWTFDPRSGRNPKSWLVPDATIFGMDVYNDWSVSDGLPWKTFREKTSMVLPYTNGKPIAVAEYGCRTDHANPGRAATWMLDAFDFASTTNIMAMAYYDSSLHSPQGTWELDAERTAAMRICRHRPNVALL